MDMFLGALIGMQLMGILLNLFADKTTFYKQGFEKGFKEGKESAASK